VYGRWWTSPPTPFVSAQPLSECTVFGQFDFRHFLLGGWGLYFAKCVCCCSSSQPREGYVDDEAKLTLHGLQQHYVKLKENEKNKKLFELLDILEFNQVLFTLHSVTFTINFYKTDCCIYQVFVVVF
jgi:hypothetical protein